MADVILKCPDCECSFFETDPERELYICPNEECCARLEVYKSVIGGTIVVISTDIEYSSSECSDEDEGEYDSDGGQYRPNTQETDSDSDYGEEEYIELK